MPDNLRGGGTITPITIGQKKINLDISVPYALTAIGVNNVLYTPIITTQDINDNDVQMPDTSNAVTYGDYKTNNELIAAQESLNSLTAIAQDPATYVNNLVAKAQAEVDRLTDIQSTLEAISGTATAEDAPAGK